MCVSVATAEPVQTPDGVRVSLTVYAVDPTSGSNIPRPKLPASPPCVWLDSYSLIFEDIFEDAVPVELTDATGNVVYSDYLPAGTQTLSLPATLSGTYTLYIYMGNYIFAGQIIL